MWLLFAAGSAFFAGITAILAKCGIRNTDSTVATAVRTIVVLIMSMMMVLIVGFRRDNNRDQRKDLAVPHALWTCHGCFLAVLFPGASGGGREQGRAGG